MAEQADATLEGQRGQGHPPSLAHLPDHVVGPGPGPVEEDLVELGGPGELGDGPDLHAGLVHGHQQIGEAVVPDRARLGPAHHEAPVGLMGQRGPHLLAGDHPLVAVELGLGLDVGQVAAGVGLRVALAPQLGAGQDGGRKRACCSGVPYWMRVGPRSPSPRTLTRPGALARTYSSLKITWWAMEAPRPPCSTGQPMPVQPSAASTFSHSSRVSNPKVSSPEPPRPPEGGELADHVVGQPGPDLLAEGLVLGSVSEVHGGGSPVSSSAG